MATNKTRRNLLLIMLVMLLTGAGILFVVQQRSSAPAVAQASFLITPVTNVLI